MKKVLSTLVFILLLLTALAFLAVRFMPQNPISEAVLEKTTAMQIGSPEIVPSVSSEKYAYNCLSDESQIVYDQVLNAILEHQTDTILSTKDTDVLQQAVESVRADYGGLFWFDGYKYQTYSNGDYVTALSFSPEYTMDKATRDYYQKKIDETVNEWLSDLPRDADDYTKSKYVFEKLITEVDYVRESADNQNIISTFIHRQTVCQGYASAASYLFDQIGIPSFIVTGMGYEETHAWNTIMLDGAYYNFDVTWGNSDFKDGAQADLGQKIVNYAYLNVTDEDFKDKHTPEVSFSLPSCTATEDSYYIRENLFFKNLDGDAAARRIGDAFGTGQATVTLKFADDEIYDAMFAYLIDGKHFADYCNGVEKIRYLYDDVMHVLTIVFM